MPEQIVDAAGKQDKNTEVVTPEKKDTIGKALDTENKEVEVKDDEPRTVPEATFLKEKGERKKLEKELKKLQERAATGDVDESEIADDIDSIAKEFDVDPKFLKKLTSAIEAKSKKEAKETVDKEVKPLKDKERKEAIDTAFKKHFGEAMAEMQDFKEIVNEDVIKTLSLDPRNANKTFKELIEETYGKALGGKRTIETTKHRGGNEPEEIDIERAQKDTKYYNEIMANPESKKKYNDGLAARLSKSL